MYNNLIDMYSTGARADTTIYTSPHQSNDERRELLQPDLDTTQGGEKANERGGKTSAAGYRDIGRGADRRRGREPVSAGWHTTEGEKRAETRVQITIKHLVRYGRRANQGRLSTHQWTSAESQIINVSERRNAVKQHVNGECAQMQVREFVRV